MKQLNLHPSFTSNTRNEHGGSLLVGKRRSRRPLSIKKPLHLVLRSDFAYGQRSLLRHRPLIEKILEKASKRFRVRVYERAIVSNHIHLLVKGHTRGDIQNFFRVLAGHIAQEILKIFPLDKVEKQKRGGASKSTVGTGREKENKFWQTRIFSRIVTWGRDYFAVKKYVIQNIEEALGIRPYMIRKKLKTRQKIQGQAPAATDTS